MKSDLAIWIIYFEFVIPAALAIMLGTAAWQVIKACLGKS